jgi:hypothetical protein
MAAPLAFLKRCSFAASSEVFVGRRSSCSILIARELRLTRRICCAIAELSARGRHFENAVVVLESLVCAKIQRGVSESHGHPVQQVWIWLLGGSAAPRRGADPVLAERRLWVKGRIFRSRGARQLFPQQRKGRGIHLHLSQLSDRDLPYPSRRALGHYR